jgi:hypothetical protein
MSTMNAKYITTLVILLALVVIGLFVFSAGNKQASKITRSHLELEQILESQ